MNNFPEPVFSIVIPFFNNRGQAPPCLATVVQAWKTHREIGEIVAVDDCSSDGTPDWLQKTYPEISLIRNERNLGFGRSCLAGVRAARCQWIILLNSDVRLDSDIVVPLLEDINRHPDLFSVGFFSFDENGRQFEGRKRLIPKTGLFKVRNNFLGTYRQGHLYDTVYASGGHMMVSREKFLALGGFSSVFEPFYWEDADLSYRAQKRGLKVFFDPRCRVVHAHRGSIRNANSAHHISIVQTRNKILFFWKNVSAPGLWFRHLSGLCFRIATSWIAGDFVFYSALKGAISRLRPLLRERSADRAAWCRSDHELFRLGSGSNES